MHVHVFVGDVYTSRGQNILGRHSSELPFLICCPFFFLNLVLCTCLFSLHVYLYLTCVPGAAGGQKRASGPFKLELLYYLTSSVWLFLMWDRGKTIFPGIQYCLIGVHRSCPQ